MLGYFELVRELTHGVTGTSYSINGTYIVFFIIAYINFEKRLNFSRKQQPKFL